MKKIFGLVVLIIIFGGCFWWQKSHNNIKGFERQTISAHEILRKWRKNSDDTLLEIQGDKLYMQESIASQGVGITGNNQLAANFVLRFDVMSVTKNTRLQVKTFEKYDDENYIFTWQTAGMKKLPAITKEAKTLHTEITLEMQPKVFYDVEISAIKGNLVMRIDGKKIAAAIDPSPLSEGQIAINIQGKIDNPAGIFIKNVELFE